VHFGRKQAMIQGMAAQVIPAQVMAAQVMAAWGIAGSPS
jgi:hypothetical protein